MKKRFMLFVVCLLLLTGCGKLQETEQEEEKQDDTPVQIGLVFDSFVIDGRRTGMYLFPLRRNMVRKSMCRMPMVILTRRFHRSGI